MTLYPEPKRQILEWIRNNPINKELRGQERKYFYQLYKQFINDIATDAQCNKFVQNDLQNNRNVFRPEITGRGKIVRAIETDRSNDSNNNNFINNPFNNPINGSIYGRIQNAKRKRQYRED